MKIKPIRTGKDYQAALARIDSLWEAAPGTDKGDELQVLTILVEDFEAERYKILPPDPIEAIKFRMEQTGMTKAELARYLGGRNRSTEILSRRRSLSVRMMKALHQELHIPAESLLADSVPPRRRRAA